LTTSSKKLKKKTIDTSAPKFVFISAGVEL
jgi:hypothetical protein